MGVQDTRYKELVKGGMSRKEALAQVNLEVSSGTLSTKSSAASSDPYGTSGVASQSVRRRGASTQQRVGTDTRVRDDASSGTGGAAGASIGAAMSEAAGTPATAQQSAQNPLWQSTRQATDLASIQQRVLQSLTNPTQRGQ